MSEDLRADESRELEGWFLRNGLPHLAVGYDPREDTLTRLQPALVVVLLLALALVLRPDWEWCSGCWRSSPAPRSPPSGWR